MSEFNAAEVRYLVVGGYAYTFHDRPRYTKYIDVWISAEPANAQRAWRALAKFGAPISDLTPEDLTRPDIVFQIGVPPNRIDILTQLLGLEFEQAWNNRVPSLYGDAPIHVIGREDLIKNKLAVGRPQDKLDVQRLERRWKTPKK